jgi:chromosome segregation ATPase
MTFVGRILIGVILFFSICFMVFAGAVFTAHNNWMKKAKDAETALNKSKTELASARTEMENLKTADKVTIDGLKGEVATLTGEKTGLAQRVEQYEVDVKTAKTELDAQREAAVLNSGEARDRAAESMLQREKNSLLYNSRNEVFANLKDAEEQLFAMELQRKQLEEKHNRLLTEAAIMRSFLASKGLPTDTKQMMANTQPPSDVDGVVLDYQKAEKGTNEFVEISLGSDDDLRIGHTLTVYNDNKYLGQIRLLRVEPDRSVGLVIAKQKNTTIKRGDNVTTKF